MKPLYPIPAYPQTSFGSMTIFEQFALHSRRKRRIQRLSQAELAYIVGTSQSAIARLEAGQGNPAADLLQRIATALELECMLIVRPRR